MTPEQIAERIIAETVIEAWGDDGSRYQNDAVFHARVYTAMRVATGRLGEAGLIVAPEVRAVLDAADDLLDDPESLYALVVLEEAVDDHRVRFPRHAVRDPGGAGVGADRRLHAIERDAEAEVADWLDARAEAADWADWLDDRGEATDRRSFGMVAAELREQIK